MNTKELLIKTRELLSDPSKWSKGSFAKDADGKDVDSKSPRAVSWCASGALDIVSGIHVRSYNAAWDILKDIGGDATVAFWNDAPERTHEEVLAAFDLAIERAE